MTNLEEPMGNTELRVTLFSMDGKLDEVIERQKYTNGTVMWHTKVLWLTMGALPLLTIWAGWLTLVVLGVTNSSAQVQTQVQQGVSQALSNYQLEETK